MYVVSVKEVNDMAAKSTTYFDPIGYKVYIGIESIVDNNFLSITIMNLSEVVC